MNDLQAIEQVKRGDIAGLAILVEKYQERAVRAAYGVTQDRQQAEDVVQTAFIQLSRTIHTFDKQRPFKPWFFKVVINAAIKAAKQRQSVLSINAVLNHETGDTFADLLPDIAALPYEQIEQAEMRKLIQEALKKLTPEQRAVIVMRYYLELETNQIATELDCPPATIRWRLYSALKRLRGLMLWNES